MPYFSFGRMMDGKRASSSPKYLKLPPNTLLLDKSDVHLICLVAQLFARTKNRWMPRSVKT